MTRLLYVSVCRATMTRQLQAHNKKSSHNTQAQAVSCALEDRALIGLPSPPRCDSFVAYAVRMTTAVANASAPKTGQYPTQL